MDDSTRNTQRTDQGRRNTAPIISVEKVDFWYGGKQALMGVDLEIFPGEIIAFMGPSGCGKSTLLKTFNRMHDEIPGTRMTGKISFDGQDIMDPDLDPVLLRRRFGWVAQAPNPFADTVYQNISYGPRLHGLVEDGAPMDAHVRHCLERAMLWEEVKTRLQDRGTDLSGGQQQRLCIARALSIKPEILLMDEPCSGVDPIASARIEDLINDLREEISIVIITHNLQQARRLSDRVAFFHLGQLVEYGMTDAIFADPHHEMTQKYVNGVYG